MAEDRDYWLSIRLISDCLESARTKLEIAMTRLEAALSEALKIRSANIDQLSLAHRAVEDALGCVREVLQLYEHESDY